MKGIFGDLQTRIEEIRALGSAEDLQMMRQQLQIMKEQDWFSQAKELNTTIRAYLAELEVSRPASSEGQTSSRQLSNPLVHSSHPTTEQDADQSLPHLAGQRDEGLISGQSITSRASPTSLVTRGSQAKPVSGKKRPRQVSISDDERRLTADSPAISNPSVSSQSQLQSKKSKERKSSKKKGKHQQKPPS